MTVLATAAVDAARVLAARDRILAAPEFNVGVDWRTRLANWFLDKLTALGDLLPATVRWVGLGLLGVGIIVALAWLWPRRHGGAARQEEALKAEPARSSAALRRDAVAALAEGRRADAVRLAWLSALSLIDEAGISSARAARADWEHVEAARRQRPPLGEPLAALALEFQRTHFGGSAPAPEDAARCLVLLRALERTVGG